MLSPATAAVPYVLMRGGTSKGVFLRAEHVPAGRDELSAFLLDLFGSPDRRQIDGLGGADKLTSKAAVMSAPSRPDADIDYLFGQVGTASAEVDYRLNCGNLTAAAAVYAIEEGFVAPTEGSTPVRVHNVNTGRVVRADVPVLDGRPMIDGPLRIDGVPGTGAAIGLDFAAAHGSISGRLLPFHEAVTRLAVSGLGTIDVTVTDGANLSVFVAAADVGMSGIESPDEIDHDAALVARLNAIRREVAHRVGLGAHWDAAAAPSAPFCVVVAAPATYARHGDGSLVRAASIDLLARQYSTAATSKAMAATVASCTGVTARIPGSVVHRVLGRAAHDRLELSIGHPSGAIRVEAAVRIVDGVPQPECARIFRTARRLADGRAYLKHAHPGIAR